MHHPIDRAVQRARRYWFDDGLTEIAVGAVFFLIALLFFAETIVPPGAFAAGLSAFGLPIVVLAGWLIAGRFVAAAKSRLTYPRTGYVAYPRPTHRRRGLALLAGAALAAVVALLFATVPFSLTLIPALQGLLAAAFWLYLGYTLGILRFYALAVFSALAGLLVALSGLGDVAGSAAYFALTGAALLASGALTLRRYLAATVPPGEE